MRGEVPILQKIHKSKATASWEPWYSEEHGAAINGIGIRSTNRGYKITTYAGGWGYDGYNISVKAEGGIFGRAPSRIETGRDHAGLIALSFGEPQTTEVEGLLQVPATASTPAKKENLLLPGDDGFELFEELHRRVQGLKPVITRAVDLIQPGIDPDTLVYENSGPQGAHFDHDKQIVAVKGETLLKVSDPSSEVIVELDATQVYSIAPPASSWNYKTNEDTVYRSGGAVVENIDGTDLRSLDLYTLVAFSAIQTAIEELYKTRVENY